MLFLDILAALILAGLTQAQTAANTSFKAYASSFSQILGNNSNITVFAQSQRALFHEAGVYHKPTSTLFVCSDTFNDPTINNNASTKLLSRVTGLDSPSTASVIILNNTDIPLPHSGYTYPGTDLLVWLGLGTLASTPPGGVYFLNPYPPYNATNILSTYGKAGPFNSPNDIAVTPDGGIWFTDPIYGYLEGYRAFPTLPNQVYRFDARTGSIRAVADGFGRPNGIGVNADGSVIYIGDTGAQIGNGSIDSTGPRTIYAFDVQGAANGGGFLGNRRLFAMPDDQAADGIKVDTKGNVYAGVGDGIAVWDSGGVLIGKILIKGGIGNIGFSEPGVLWGMGGKILWRIDLSKNVVGASPLN